MVQVAGWVQCYNMASGVESRLYWPPCILGDEVC